MLKTILTSLRSPELRKKLLFTAFILLVYRFGSFVPTPGIDLDALQAALDQRGSRLLDFLNLFAGGALTRFAVFALGIMPYITASIILQLMTVVIPSLEKLQKEGESGQQKITQYTRYFTVVLALLQSMAYVLYFRSQDALPGFTPRPLLPDRHLGDGRHRAADVARRADHPARRRQRHLAADLREHRLVGARRRGRLARRCRRCRRC